MHKEIKANMMQKHLTEKAKTYLDQLCGKISNRRVGSSGNRAATDFFADVVTTFGFDIETPVFDCIDWRQDGARLTVDATSFAVQVSPYSLGGHIQAPLVVLSSVEGLEAAEITQAVVLLQGDLAQEPLMPKNFPFYNPEAHQRIIQLLEAKNPQAIVAATSRNPEMAGAVYPFPLIEDGDFDIPSVYMTEEEGTRLAEHAGEVVTLDIEAVREPAKGCNVIARKGAASQRRVVVFAHIDAKDDTPGALDNASGIVVLLLLAELLADYAGELGVEIAALNGEDYYDAPGQQQYLRANEGAFEAMLLGINLDGAGYHQGHTAYSLYDCPPAIAAAIQETFARYPELIEGEPWYQGDHSLFLINQTPALAFTSERVEHLLNEIVHTPKDTPEIVDAAKLVQVARALHALLLELDQLPA
jgi:aminopeptidase YwaD